MQWFNRFHSHIKQLLPGGFKSFLFSPLLGEDSHFDSVLLFNWVKATNQIQISFYHLSSRIHATHRSTVMWLHWFRLRGGQWLRGLFILWLGWVLVMSCDMTSHFKPFQWNPGWWNVCVTSNVHIIEMNISIFSTQIWRAFWKFSPPNRRGVTLDIVVNNFLEACLRWVNNGL